jgi:hypothetical protein
MGSVPAMRIGDHLSWIPFVAGSAAAALKAGWLAGLVVLVVATLLTWIVNDIRKAGGLAPWAIKLVSVADAWDEYKTRHAKRRGKRKEEALRRARRVAELKRETGDES